MDAFIPKDRHILAPSWHQALGAGSGSAGTELADVHSWDIALLEKFLWHTVPFPSTLDGFPGLS